ncbi:lipoprotein signal peptidase [Gloeomargarita lithophora Alchichica-D10]|uniref:Lipoprotein signal peptidase n=1 Tax=Gloeomargarita lithophora Alchichica-D10 TaxID=1188229 RepID=A0A1J0AGQ1_9CYAN|nr:signal peptidase II [Gloeomargarita lithophora]APB35080.1 lipoprotein signal peptidase [Gloeomargarita lithophora Alchichica-D10]
MVKHGWFWVAAGTGVLLDQLSKSWVGQNFGLGESWPLWAGVFHFTYVLNTGAAFSLFVQGTAWLRWLSVAVSAGLMALAVAGPRLAGREQWGYGLILAGAVGNGIDRFRLGAVIDFLDVRWISFPIFNLADVWINLGLVCLFWHYLRPHSSQNS